MSKLLLERCTNRHIASKNESNTRQWNTHFSSPNFTTYLQHLLFIYFQDLWR